LIVSAERRFVTAVGSASPVKAATLRCGTVVEVVEDVEDVEDVDVVVVVSAAPTLAAAPLSMTATTTTRGRRRIRKNYLVSNRR
jgi:hypothetical protein